LVCKKVSIYNSFYISSSHSIWKAYNFSYLQKRRLHIALFLFIDSAATMSQLHASSKSSMLSPYFAKPSSSYEKFVNKKWAERNDIFETKKKLSNAQYSSGKR